MQSTPMDFSVEKLHPLTKKLLEKRGIIENEEVYDFLFPSYEKHIGDPFDIHGVKEAVERIVEAIKNSEKIAVYSDYDCDGVPGGVLLRTFFDDIGYPVEMYIPHRHNEGYGVHVHAIDALKEKGVTLIVTVDSGIANIDEVAYAKSIGVDFIVTDHHLPITAIAEETQNVRGKDAEDTEKKSESKKATGHKLQATSSVYQVVPDAVAVINSKQDVCSYHDDMLCGCAVAWKLSCAILSALRADKIAQDNFHAEQTRKRRRKDAEKIQDTDAYSSVLEKVAALPEGYEKWYLDLVGISTVADMVPLVKENRALAHYGLKVLRKTKRHGLLHIFNEQRVKKEFLTEDDIAFTIAPRVNAASRMGDPIQAHLMLYERDREQAEQYARELEDLNTQRKSEVKDVVDSISFDHDSYKNDVVVVGNKEWGPGILGLIAQKIIDETKKPVFVWGMGEDVGGLLKGSCRSLGDVSVVDLMAHVGKVSHGGYFDNYGGHEGAGGFSLAEENLEKASSALQEALKHVEKKSLQEQTIEADISISLDDINDTTYEAVAILAPFGEGNRKPVFELSDARALATKWFGKKNEHFEVLYGNANGKRVKAIKFFAPKDIEEKVNKKHSPLVHLEKSYFGGRVELRMRVVEVR